jgi:hypothetical protein
MDLNDLRTVLDFGMVVLLWLVQRVIYPEWHLVTNCLKIILTFR